MASLFDQNQAAALCVTASAAANASAQLTLPVISGGVHHICAIEIQAHCTGTQATASAALQVTTSNLPGAPVILFDTAANAVGTVRRWSQSFAIPIRSASATGTSFTLPAQGQTRWQMSVWYY